MGELYQPTEGKRPWQSKTLWVNLLLAVLAFFPQFRDIVTEELLGTLFTVVNVALRFVTKDKIEIKKGK